MNGGLIGGYLDGWLFFGWVGLVGWWLIGSSLVLRLVGLVICWWSVGFLAHFHQKNSELFAFVEVFENV